MSQNEWMLFDIERNREAFQSSLFAEQDDDEFIAARQKEADAFEARVLEEERKMAELQRRVERLEAQ